MTGLDAVRGRATISIAETAQLLDLGINQTYAAAREGSIPALKLGRVYRVPVPALLALLGETPDAREAPVPADAPADIHVLGQEKGAHGHGAPRSA